MQERENQTGSSAEEPRVRVMSEDEARDYQGVTIEERKEDGEQRVEEPQDRYGRADDLRGSGIRIHTFGTTGSMSWLTRRHLPSAGRLSSPSSSLWPCRYFSQPQASAWQPGFCCASSGADRSLFRRPHPADGMGSSFCAVYNKISM